MKETNLFLYPQQYKASVDWNRFSVVNTVRQVGEQNVLTLPPASRLPFGLVSRFVQLRNYEDKSFKDRLSSFVADYGMLGVIGYPEYSYNPPLYGQSDEEYIDWWVDYATDVNRLLQLYRAIKRAKIAHESDVPDIISKVIVFGQENNFINSFWAETGEQTGFMLKDSEITNSEMIEGACYVLVGSISRGMAGGISLGVGGFKQFKIYPIGYSITEERYTYSPLAAVYNELWEKVRANDQVEVCLYCGGEFFPLRSTGKFCSDKCRVAYSRLIKKQCINAN